MHGMRHRCSVLLLLLLLHVVSWSFSLTYSHRITSWMVAEAFTTVPTGGRQSLATIRDHYVALVNSPGPLTVASSRIVTRISPTSSARISISYAQRAYRSLPTTTALSSTSDDDTDRIRKSIQTQTLRRTKSVRQIPTAIMWACCFLACRPLSAMASVFGGGATSPATKLER